jgi:NAD(P)-dependent dehydrogenase (short-subunit alcohol dehydrogenase family)
VPRCAGKRASPTLPRMDVAGKTAIVTGASRGIGKQVAIELGRLGANVVVAARTVDPHRRLPGTIGETVDAVQTAGGSALAVRTDLADVHDVDALVAAAVDEFGGVDVLVNNAADTGAGPNSILALDRDDWLRQFDTNLHAPLSLIKAVVPVMQTRGGGVIVDMTSGAGDLFPLPPASSEGATVFPERIAYAATKAALNRLGNAIAPELRALGIAIVSVDPGFTRTELVDLMGERGLVDPNAAVPMEVPVKTVLHLITSEDGMAYTGQVLRADAFVREHSL